jgi:hypothetical protein
MKTFKEFSLDEQLSTQSRLKKKQSLRRNKAKIKLGKLRASRKLASQDVIAKRARRAARAFMFKRLVKGKTKNELPYSSRQTYEKIIDRRKGAVDKLAKRLIPKIRKAEMQRKLNRRQAQSGSVAKND